MIKKPLWINEDLQKKFLMCKAVLGYVNVEQVLLKCGIIEQLNKILTDTLKKQTENTKELIKNGRKTENRGINTI